MKGGTRKRGKTWSYCFDTAQIGGKRKKIEKGGFRTKKERIFNLIVYNMECGANIGNASLKNRFT